MHTAQRRRLACCALIGAIYPTTHFLTISSGTFSKALGLAELGGAFLPLAAAIPPPSPGDWNDAELTPAPPGKWRS